MNRTWTIEHAQPHDREAIRALLAAARLPLDGLEDHWDRVLLSRHEGRVVGCIAFELHGRACVLRSLAVDPGSRGSGLGRRLVKEGLDAARAAGAEEAYGLTHTAERMMTHLGFRAIDRGDVPEEVRRSTEFNIPACSTAVAIHRRL